MALKGKKIVIIGGSAGIGFATAKAADAKDARIIIVSSSQERIDKALKNLSGNAKGFVADAGNEHELKNLFEQIGNFDHLVYTAGDIIEAGLLSETNIEQSKQFFNVRFWGALSAVKYATPLINKGGSVTLTSGIASERPYKGWGLGASMTSAMEGFTRAMAMELAPIRVNVVSPGIVKTDLWSAIPEENREQFFSHSANLLPVGKVASPEDMALSYIYLMEQTYSTGQTIIADGGGTLINIYSRL